MDDQEPSPNASSFEDSNSSAPSASGSSSMSSNDSGSASSHKSSNNNARSNGSSMLNGYDESDAGSNAIGSNSAITSAHPSYHDHSTYHSTGQFVNSDSFKNGIHGEDEDEDDEEEIEEEEVDDDEPIDGEDQAIDESFEPESADQSEQEDDDQENASVVGEDDLDAEDAEDAEEGLEAAADDEEGEEEEEEEADEAEEEDEEVEEEEDDDELYSDNRNDHQFAQKSRVNHEFDDDGDEDAEEEEEEEDDDDINSGEIGDGVDEFVDEEEDESLSHSNVKAIAQADSVTTSNSNSGHSRSIENNNTAPDEADGDVDDNEAVTQSKNSLSVTSNMQTRRSRHSIDSLSNVRDLTEGTNRVNFLSGEFTSDGEAEADADAEADVEADAGADVDADDNLIDSTQENQRNELINDPSADDEDDAAADTSLPPTDDTPDDGLTQSDPLSPVDEKLDQIRALPAPSNLSDAELAVRNHFHREFGNIFDDGDGKVRLLHGQGGSKTPTETEYFCIFCQHRTKDKDEIRHHYQKHMNYYPVICSSCGFLAFDLPHFLDHHASFHPKSPKGRYKRKEIPHVDRWINGFIYAQATIIKAFPPREQCPVCEIIFSPDEISASKPRRYTVNRKIDHVHRHLAYLPYECIKCKEVSGKEFLVGYFESKAHSHIKLKHPDVAIQDSRWYVFQKTLGIATLDEWIANYLGKFGISMTHERRPVKKQRLIESNAPMDNFPLDDTDGDDFDDDCPDLPEVNLEQVKLESDTCSSDDLMVIDVPPEMVDLDLIDTVEHDTKVAESDLLNCTPTEPLSVNNTNYICIFCEENFTNVNDISKHLASEHFNYQPILCLTCQNGFADMVTLSTHHLDCHEVKSGYELKFEVRENFSLEKWIADFARSQKLGSFSKMVLNCRCSKYCPACCKVKKMHRDVKSEADDHESLGPCPVHNDSSFMHHIKTHLSYFQYQCLPCKLKGKVVKFVTLKGDAYNHLYREHVLHKRISASKIQSSFPKLLAIKLVDELIRSSLIAWKSNCGTGRCVMTSSNLKNITNNSDNLNAFGNLTRSNLYPVTDFTEGILKLQEVIRQQLLQESMSPKSLLLRKKQQKLHQQQLLATRGIDYQSSLRVTTTQEGRMVVKSFKAKPSPTPKTINGGGGNINGYGQGKSLSNSLLNSQPQVRRRGRPPLYTRAENAPSSNTSVNMNSNINSNCNNSNVNRNAIGSIVSNLTKSKARSNIKQMTNVNRPISNSIPQPKYQHHQQQQQQKQQQQQQQQHQHHQQQQQQQPHQASSSHSSHSNHIRIEAGRVVNLPQSPSPAINMSSSSNRNRSVPKRSIYNVTNNSFDSHNSTTNNQFKSGNVSLSNIKSVKSLKPTMKVPSSSSSSSSSSAVKCLHCNLTIPNLLLLKYHTINEHKGLTVNYMPVQSFVK